MSGMEDQLGAILGDPEMMRKIQALAQSMEQTAPAEPTAPKQPPSQPPPPPPLGGIDTGDLEMVKAFAGFARGAEIDKDQRALLKALAPYVSREKITKLEKAMRSAKMAQQASALLGSGTSRE